MYLAHVGRFLRTNRSVNLIGFDSSGLILDAEGTKELRGAFYGNKKVTSFKSLTKAGEATRKRFREIINKELGLIADYKYQIKRIFQR